jgi:F-type H+-transporting ATPase subunit delta
LAVAENATVARPYAHAAFDSANGAGQLARWGEVLARASAVITDDRVASLLGNPHVRGDELVALVGDIAGIGDDGKLRNFVQLLADNGRLALLPAISAQYEALRADVENTIDVTVTSAMPLTAEQAERLVAALRKRLGRTVRLQSTVDATLVGGAVVRAGDFVFDGSLRGRLERLGNIMAGA